MSYPPENDVRPSPCGFGIIVSAHREDSVRFAGAALKKHNDWQENDVWVEFKCNREGKHPTYGKHWHEGDGWRFEWEMEYDKDALWLA